MEPDASNGYANSLVCWQLVLHDRFYLWERWAPNFKFTHPPCWSDEWHEYWQQYWDGVARSQARVLGGTKWTTIKSAAS